MRPPKQKQPQVKKGLCRVLEHVDVDVDVMAPNYVKCKRSIDPLERRRILGHEPTIIIFKFIFRSHPYS